jgi:hypothetical protein
LFVDPSVDLEQISPYKRENRDPKVLLGDLETLYLSSTDTPSLHSQEGPDSDEEDLRSARHLKKSLKRKDRERREKQVATQVSISDVSKLHTEAIESAHCSSETIVAPDLSDTTETEAEHDYEQELREIMSAAWNANGLPQQQMGVENHGAPPPANPVDLQSMYFDQSQSPYYGSPSFAAPQVTPFASPPYPNSYSNMSNGQYLPYSQQPPNFQYQNSDPSGLRNLNPYACEFNPNQFGAPPAAPPQSVRQSNPYMNNNDHGNYKETDYKQRSAEPAPYAKRHISDDDNTPIEIPDGAITLTMPHVYLGLFIKSRSEYEDKYDVSITTNSKDGGYLIIITGDRASEAAKEMELIWNDEPITSSENIVEGKHVIKVAPDRFEGVVCVPAEYHQILLDKRNEVESKHKVRILTKHLPDVSRYRAVIRAPKKSIANDAADDLETLVLSEDPHVPEPPTPTSPTTPGTGPQTPSS